MEKADIMEMTTNFLYMLIQQKNLTGRVTLPVQPPATQVRAAVPSYIPAPMEDTRSAFQDYSRGYSVCQAEINNYLHKYGIQRPTAFATMTSPMTSPIASSTPLVKPAALSRRHSMDEQHISSTTPFIPQPDFSQPSTSAMYSSYANTSDIVDNREHTMELSLMQKSQEENNNSSVEKSTGSSVNCSNSSGNSSGSSCWRPW
jgi:hypothetical protein